MKKLMTVLLAVAMLGLAPMLAGCGDKHYVHSESTTTTTESTVIVE